MNRLWLCGIFLLLSTLSVGQVFEWTAQLGGINMDEGYAIAIDNNKNVYTTGFFAGLSDFDPGQGVFTLNSHLNGRDVFVSKLDSAGNLVWAKQLGGTNDDYAKDIAVDDSGNVYILGTFLDSADFDPGPGTKMLYTTYYADIFLCKLNSLGNLVWVKQFIGLGVENGNSLVRDNTGNIYLAGNFTGKVDFDPGPDTSFLYSPGGNSFKYFICKLNSAGNLEWAIQQTGLSSGSISGISVDSSGNIYATGDFKGTADFDPGPDSLFLSTPNFIRPYAFVLKLDSNSNLVWALHYGPVISDESQRITVDSKNNVCVSGNFGGTIDFDPGPNVYNLTASGSYDSYISKFDATGNILWVKKLTGNSTEVIYDITTDTSGNIYTAGIFNGTTDFNPAPSSFSLTSHGIYDGFINIWNSNGQFVWATQYGAAYSDYAKGIAVDSERNIYTTGLFLLTVDFDPGGNQFGLTSFGSSDIFVQKLRPSSIGLREYPFKSRFKCYPNPTSGIVAIDLGNEYVNVNLSVRNLLGHVLIKKSYEANQMIEITLDLNPGIYFIEIETGKIHETLSVIRQ